MPKPVGDQGVPEETGGVEGIFVPRRPAAKKAPDPTASDADESMRRKSDKEQKDKTEKKSKKDKKEKGDGSHKKEKKSKKEERHAKGIREEYRPVPAAAKRNTPPKANGVPPLALQAGVPSKAGSGAGQKTGQATHDESSSNAIRPKKRRKTCLQKFLRALTITVFLAAYFGAIVFLVLATMEAKANEITADDSEVCRRLECPLGSVCVDDSGKGSARCSKNQHQNLQILEIVLGIVAGVPAAICLPCSAQWLLRSGGPWICSWYTERARRRKVSSAAKASHAAMKRSPAETVLETDDEDLEHGGQEEAHHTIDVPRGKAPSLFTRLQGMLRGRRQANQVPDSSAVVGVVAGADMPIGNVLPESTPIGATQADPNTDVGGSDTDDMADFFAKTGMKKEANLGMPGDAAGAGGEQGGSGGSDQDDLDFIFASRREVNNVPPPLPPPDAPLAPPDEDEDDDIVLDKLFAKASKLPPAPSPAPAAAASPGTGEEASFEDFFHRPARRAKDSPGPVQAPVAVKTPAPPAGRGAPQKGGMALPPIPTSAPARAADVDAASRAEFSEGLSAIFAATKLRPKGRPGSNAASSLASSRARGAGGSQSSASQAEEDDFEDEEEGYMDEAGEAPDFIGYALGIARQAPGAGKSDARGEEESWLDFGELTAAADAMSDASGGSAVDSLADLEASNFEDLFHQPLLS